MTDPKPIAVDGGIYIEIQRFLFREAALLDRREYGAWLALTTEDIQYRVSAAVSRDAAAKAVDYSIVDENLVGLEVPDRSDLESEAYAGRKSALHDPPCRFKYRGVPQRSLE